MKNLKSFSYLFLLVLSCPSLFGQNPTSKLHLTQLRDSVKKYEEKEEGVYEKLYLEKAKQEKDTFHLAEAYGYMSYLVEFDESMKYADSVLHLYKYKEDERFPALGYMLKAWFLYNKGLDKASYEQFSIAYQYALKNNNISQQNYIRQYMGTIKFHIGQYKEAIKIYKDEYYKIITQPNYLDTYQIEYFEALCGISTAYLRAKEIDSSFYYINEGLRTSKQLNDSIYHGDFLDILNYYYYFKEDYDKALDGLQNRIPFQIQTNNNHDLALNYYYQGRIYESQNNDSLTLLYFNKVDSLYLLSKNPFLELKNVYKSLYDYNFKHKNKNQQLHAIDKLIEIDSIFTDASIGINSVSITDYEIPKLKEEKEKLLEELNEEHNKTNYILIIAILLSLIFISILIKLYLDKKKLKSRFESIVQKQDANSNSIIDKAIETPSKETQNQLSISQEVIDSILQALAQFENNKDYLDNQITLASLAKQFSTNSVYLSKVINHNKGMSFSNYLSNLRIVYCIAELRENSTLRNYTIKAIAQEIGFRNSESFSKAFKKETGLNPSYYIKALNKLYDNKVNT